MSAERANDCYVALELSQRTWLIGYLLPGSDKAQTTAVAGGNAEALLSARGDVVDGPTPEFCGKVWSF